MPASTKKKIKEHLHILVRWKKFFGEMCYKCDDPDCEYTARKDFLQGKRSLCSVCKQEEIILDTENLNLSRPRCQNCSRSNEAKQGRKLKNTLEGLLGGQ